MKPSTMNLISLAALASFPYHVIAQELCTAVVVTVTVYAEPTPEPTPESSIAAVSEVASSSTEPCSQETDTSTVTDWTTVTVTPTSYEAAQPTSMGYSPAAPVEQPSSSLVLSDFVFASTAAAAAASAPVDAESSPAVFAPSPSKSTSAPAPAKSNAAPAKAAGSALGTGESGQATFYGGNVAGGTCSFSTYTLPSGMFGTALSDSNWDSAGNCGACVSVTGPSGNSITAMIVDECPGCGKNHLDLFPDAFAKLADPSKGVIDVTWEIVECGISSPISLHNKDGTSAFWFSMQVVNSNVPITKLEVSTDGKNWSETQRQDYNFFENQSGFGTETVSVRITSLTGKTITVDNVSVASGSSVSAGSNF